MIKILSEYYFEECVSFVHIRSRTSGTIHTSESVFRDRFKDYFIESDSRKCFGYFDNQNLISFMFVKYMENKIRGKFWTITGYYSKITRNYFSWSYPESGLLLKHVIEYAENNKYYEWYYTVSKRIMNVFENQWKKNPFVPIGRYDLITLDTIPPNTVPDVELYWKLIGEEIKPDPMIVKKRVLRPEFKN